MSFEHNQMAHESSAALLQQLRSGGAAWTLRERLTDRTIYWQGVIDWPRPDNAFQDPTTGASFAIEFKPPGHGKSEYVRGLGQAMTYLQLFEMAAVVMPRLAVDGYPIADYLGTVLESPSAANLPICLFCYDQSPSALTVRTPLRPRLDTAPPIPSARTVFWAYWRDLSHYEVFEIIKIMDLQRVDFDAAFESFWTTCRSTGKAKDWEARPRKTAPIGGKYYQAEIINSRLSLQHSGLIDSRRQLTESGYQLLHHGKIYGPDSVSFRMKLARQILLVGRHLELIFWVDQEQKRLSEDEKADPTKFRRALDTGLQAAGIINRVPSTNGKTNFLRDEPKLWRKLGLLTERDGRSYFFESEGYRFDWRRIVSVVNTEM